MTIKVGSVKLPLHEHAKGWRFAWKDALGKWHYVTRTNKQEAIDLAREKALEISNGAADLSKVEPNTAAILQRVLALGITHADIDQWEKARRIACPAVSVVVATMINEKEQARGEKGIHLRGMETDLRTLPQDVPLNNLGVDDVNAWLAGHRARGVSQRRLRNLRGSVVTLWRWAQARGMVPEGKTVAERTAPISSTRGKGRERAIAIYSPKELQALITAAPPQWRHFIVLGAFAGLRTEEMAPRATTKSEGLMWQNIDRKRGLIRMPAHVSKTGHPRIVPIQPNLKAWLKDAPAEGPILPESLSASRYALHKQLKPSGVVWKGNALRHSFGTYRTAQTQNIAQVALEMGNTAAMIQRHYYEAVSEEEGCAWFKIFPPRQNSVVPMGGIRLKPSK